MRYLFALLLLMAQPWAATAQAYQPFLETGKTWDLIYNFGTHPQDPDFTVRFTAAGDTTVGGLVYQRLLQPLSPGQPAVLLREDLTTRQVFVREDGADRLIYDFSLLPGDSLDHFFVLDSIAWITLLNGEQRRIFHFSPDGFWPNFYVEGIGGSCDLLDPLHPAV